MNCDAGLEKRHHGYIFEHHDKMTYTSCHYKKMKYFVCSEVFVAGVKKRKLECIDYSSDSIDYSSGEKPVKGGFRQSVNNLGKRKDTHPAHYNI